MDLVKEFKNKLDQVAKSMDWKYKILYKGYETALKENRLHVYFHKPGKLAEVITPKGTVSFEIAGDFEATLMSPDGEVLTLTDCIPPLSPFDTTTVDDVGVSHDGISVAKDQDILKYSDQENEWHFEYKTTTFVQAVFGERVYVFEDPSIAKAVFDIKAITELIEEEKKPSRKKSKKEEPKEVPAEEPVEEVAAEPAEDKPEVKEEPADDKPVKEKAVAEKASPIKDSGNRTKFKSGAVRDIQSGKGRCDLLPLDIVGEFFECTPDKSGFEEISLFQEDHDRSHLIKAAKALSTQIFPDDETAILEYACHLEDGCNKYGDRNWEKGIPLSRFIDSGIRHFLKFKRGDDDERHDRAFIWNMLCGAWTCKHHPELINE